MKGIWHTYSIGFNHDDVFHRLFQRIVFLFSGRCNLSLNIATMAYLIQCRWNLGNAGSNIFYPCIPGIRREQIILYFVKNLHAQAAKPRGIFSDFFSTLVSSGQGGRLKLVCCDKNKTRLLWQGARSRHGTSEVLKLSVHLPRPESWNTAAPHHELFFVLILCFSDGEMPFDESEEETHAQTKSSHAYKTDWGLPCRFEWWNLQIFIDLSV